MAALSLLALLALWALAAWIAQSRHFPGPAAVGSTQLPPAIKSGELPYHTGITLARVAASFALAFAIGSPIGIALGRFPKLDLFFDSWLILFLNLPALIIIILCFVWLGQNEAGGRYGGCAEQNPECRGDLAGGNAGHVARL